MEDAGSLTSLYPLCALWLIPLPFAQLPTIYSVVYRVESTG